MPPTMGEVMQHNGCSTSTVIYRSGPFQVQQVIMCPNSEIVDHNHPNVDSFVLYGSGDVTFRKNDEVGLIGVTPGVDWLRIKETDWHGGTYGPRGGVFFTIQHWLDGAPGTRKNHVRDN